MKQSSVRWLLLAICAAACGGPQKAGKSGSVCFRDDDCVLGLVCVAPEGSTDRVCSDDVTGIISEVDAGIPAAMGGAAGSTAGAGNAGATASGGAAPANGGAPASGGVSASGGASAPGGAGNGGASASAGTGG